MTDSDLAQFLNVPIEYITRLQPQSRARYERMAKVCADIRAWENGTGPKPAGVLIDGPRTKLPDMRKTPAKPGKNQRGHAREIR